MKPAPVQVQPLPAGVENTACECAHARTDHLHARGHCLATVTRTGLGGGVIRCSCHSFAEKKV